MSAEAVFPALWKAAERKGGLARSLRPPVPIDDSPTFLAPRGGMFRLVERLVDVLTERDVELRARSSVDEIDLVDGRWSIRAGSGDRVVADGLVIALPSTHAARLVGPHDFGLAGLLNEIGYATVTTVTMAWPEGAVDHPFDGTGYLVPATSGWLTTACTWTSAKWPHLGRPGEVLLRASVGRYGDDRAIEMEDNELVDRVVRELRRPMGITGDPLEVVVTRWPEAFPQYAVGHLSRVSAIESATANLPAVALAGAAYRGVGIPACIGSGREAAGKVLETVERR
jgi:oxygen-dependent protoporphyrinogen oxidase